MANVPFSQSSARSKTGAGARRTFIIHASLDWLPCGTLWCTAAKTSYLEFRHSVSSRAKVASMFMMSLVHAIQDRLATRRRYRRAIAEIDALTQSDLIEIGAFQIDLYRAAHKQIYG